MKAVINHKYCSQVIFPMINPITPQRVRMKTVALITLWKNILFVFKDKIVFEIFHIVFNFSETLEDKIHLYLELFKLSFVNICFFDIADPIFKIAIAS